MASSHKGSRPSLGAWAELPPRPDRGDGAVPHPVSSRSPAPRVGQKADRGYDVRMAPQRGLEVTNEPGPLESRRGTLGVHE